jgi:uncharacterized lipoprotein
MKKLLLIASGIIILASCGSNKYKNRTKVNYNEHITEKDTIKIGSLLH